MIFNTINDMPTIAGNGEGTILVGRYRIVRQLGKGGMGSVWLVEDMQLDNKQFAIKMLPSILVRNMRAYRQLKEEALVAMRLVHPNIVQIRAFEENNGNPFLVMDYVDGQTLDDYIAEKGTLTEEDVIRVLSPISAALDYAHGKGVVHRDVKPGNVMIAKDGTPFILDFGIAREIQETLTRVTGKLSSGTLLYMSPEQLNGEKPSPAQDVYSFAAMAYECLKGEPPFSRGQIEFQILNEEPESLTGSVAISAPLAASVMAGLAKKPEDRPRNCAGVLERRRATPQGSGTQGEGDAESPHSGGSRPVASVKGILIAALLAALVGGGYYVWMKYDECVKAREERIAKLKAEKERVEAEKRKIEAERDKREKELAEERARFKKAIGMSAKPKSAKELTLAEQAARQKEEARLERKARIDTHLGTAKKSMAASKWQQCVEACDTVLGWDADNAEAKRLKAEAERHLVPVVRVVAKIGGREVPGANLNDGKKIYKMPLEWTLEGGKTYGPYKVSYENGGKWYFGTFDAVTVDWIGSKEIAVALKGAIVRSSMRKVAHDKVQLWAGGPYWATTNIGAERPENYGYYFWWGDTVGYKREGDSWVASDGSLSNFSFCGTNTPTYSKSYDALKREGWNTADGVLASGHDAALRHWGGNWRMPTRQEFDGLNDKCDWKWTAKNGVNGYEVRGKGDFASASIFLPCAGYGNGTSLDNVGSNGYYWSSVPSSSDLWHRKDSWHLRLESGYHFMFDSRNRHYGQSVRPVQGFTK